MKTRIYKYCLVFLASIILLFGCSKDFLDTKQMGVINTDQFYKTDADATAAIMSCYNMWRAMYSSIWTSMWMTKMALSDEIYCGGENSGDRPEYQELNKFTFGPTNAPISNLYRYMYMVIFRANVIINKFSALPNETDYQKMVVGEAKAIRGFMYLELASLYGTPPLVLRELAPSEYSQPNSTQDELYTQIEKDCSEAAAVLPEKSQQATNGSDVARISKGAALAFLGKAYLYHKKYHDAAVTLKALASSPEYGLYTLAELSGDYSNLFKKATEFGKESVFEINYTSERGNSWSDAFGDLWNDPSRTNPSNTVWQLCGPRGDQGFNGGSLGINGGWGFGYPTYSLYDAFKAAGDSVRVHANIINDAQIQAAGGTLRKLVNGVPTNYPWGCPGFIRAKYTTWASETAGPVGELNYGTNYRIMRFADVLLMAAEACIQDNDQTSANNYLSQVRGRVNLSTPATVTMDDIKLERRLELAFEGSRYQDLCRWGDAADVLKDQGKVIPTGNLQDPNSPDTNPVYGVTFMHYSTTTAAGFKAKNYLFPIPFNEISANTLIKQNPGY